MAFIVIGKSKNRMAINIDKIVNIEEMPNGDAKILYKANASKREEEQNTTETFDDLMNQIACQQQLQGKINFVR